MDKKYYYLIITSKVIYNGNKNTKWVAEAGKDLHIEAGSFEVSAGIK